MSNCRRCGIDLTIPGQFGVLKCWTDPENSDQPPDCIRRQKAVTARDIVGTKIEVGSRVVYNASGWDGKRGGFVIGKVLKVNPAKVTVLGDERVFGRDAEGTMKYHNEVVVVTMEGENETTNSN